MFFVLYGTKKKVTYLFPSVMQAVSVEDGAALALEYQIEFFETSAKENINVDECFLALGKASKDRLLAADYPVNEANLSSFPLSAQKQKQAANESSSCSC